jgi:hypothetical protein
VLTVAGNSLASHRSMTRERSARRDHSQRSPARTSQPSTTRLKANRPKKDVAAECSHRDISHAGGSEDGKVGNREDGVSLSRLR